LKAIYSLLFLCLTTSLYSQNIQWEKSFGGGSNEFVAGICRANDGGFVVLSSTGSNNNDVSGNHGGDDVWVLKLSETGQKIWQVCLGAAGSETGFWISPVAGNGYIIAATTSSNGPKNGSQVFGNHGGQDVWLIKITDQGAIEWRRCYGGCEQDDIRCVIPTSDGGYMAVGGTQTLNSGDVYGAHGGKDGWIIKVDENGELLWQRTVGGSGNNDYLYEVEETPDGDFVIAGAATSTDGDLANNDNKGLEDLWVFKINSVGDFIWSKTYGGSGSDGARNMSLAFDNKILLGGFTQSTNGDVDENKGGSDVWVVFLDADGNMLWESSFGGSGNDAGFDLFQRTANDFVIIGETSSSSGDVSGYHGGKDIWLVKFDKDGNLTDQICLGGSLEEQSRTIIPGSSASEIIIGGNSTSQDGDVSQNFGARDAWILKLDIALGLKQNGLNQHGLQIKVTPNPVLGSLNIQSDISGKKRLEIFNFTGQLMKTVETFDDSTLVDVSAFPAGKYAVKLSVVKSGEFTTAEFIKH
jgi:hypothetical protein